MASGEECDDGNLVDGDGCQAGCELPRCGDGIRDASQLEECDTGVDNSDLDPDACRTNGRSPWCGDGVIDPSNGEDCDDPDCGCSPSPESWYAAGHGGKGRQRREPAPDGAAG